MRAQNVVRKVQMQGWAHQIDECERSGLSVRHWCEENGVNTKTYYYRRKRVREELFESVESGSAAQLSQWTPKQMEVPVFAAFPMRRRSELAVTVQIGAYVADIHNGADAETVEGVLRTLTSL